jgi:DNA-binding Lrp family transcriptional regulator
MIDKIDQELILQLQKNGRESYIDLAEKCHLSETAVRYRVKQLINKELISITAIPKLKLLGYDFMAIVGLQVRLADLQTTTDSLIKHPNVCYLANVTGRFDLIAIVVTKTTKEFADFMQDVISVLPSVSRTETFVNLNTYMGQLSGLGAAKLISQLEILE